MQSNYKKVENQSLLSSYSRVANFFGYSNDLCVEIRVNANFVADKEHPGFKAAHFSIYYHQEKSVSKCDYRSWPVAGYCRCMGCHSYWWCCNKQMELFCPLLLRLSMIKHPFIAEIVVFISLGWPYCCCYWHAINSFRHCCRPQHFLHHHALNHGFARCSNFTSERPYE